MLLFVCAALALLTLRFYIFYFVVAAAVGTFVFGGRGSLAGRLLSCGVLIAALAGGFTLGARQETLEAQAAFMTLNQVQVTRVDQAMWGKSAYGTEYDVTTTGGALQALPVGLVYLLFAPFPWAITGMRQLLTLPETLVWYALMPAFARGLVYSIRHRLRDVLPILVFTVTLTLAYALMQGNVGTAYRQRTQVTMFFFVFMGVGIVERQRRRALATEAGGFDVSSQLARLPRRRMPPRASSKTMTSSSPTRITTSSTRTEPGRPNERETRIRRGASMSRLPGGLSACGLRRRRFRLRRRGARMCLRPEGPRHRGRSANPAGCDERHAGV